MTVKTTIYTNGQWTFAQSK